jgi:hypothetical protein
MSRLSVSFDIYSACDSLAAVALIPRSFADKEQAKAQYTVLVSVASLFGRHIPIFKALFSLIRNILQDDLGKTIVSIALGSSSTIRGTKCLA